MTFCPDARWAGDKEFHPRDTLDTGLSANAFGVFYCVEVLYVPNGSQPSSKKLSNPKELTPLSLNMEEEFVSSQVLVPTGKIWRWFLLWPPGSTERPPSPIPALRFCFLPLQAHVAPPSWGPPPSGSQSCLPTMCSTPPGRCCPLPVPSSLLQEIPAKTPGIVSAWNGPSGTSCSIPHPHFPSFRLS